MVQKSMKNLTYKKYITTETACVELYYDRPQMKYGEAITGYEINETLKKGLLECEEVVFSMYWKPLGDSFLFLSVIQATHEFLLITRPNNLPKYILDSTFSNLLRHIDILESAEIVNNAIDYFKDKHNSGTKAALVTDDDPFTLENYPVIFNSENYIYPKFINKKHSIEYISRPARYFLTFERELGVRLKSDPNDSLPVFNLKYDKKTEEKIENKYKIKVSDNIDSIAIISQAGEIEKRYGTLKFLKLYKTLKQKLKLSKCFLIANWKEESPEEWFKVKKLLATNPDIILIDTENFEILSYIFSRCRFVIGNDTGFSHLAAMSKNLTNNQLPKVIILYSRHDFGKWSTGKSNVIPIATKLAKYLTKNNMSLRRDKIDEKIKGKNEWVFSINEKIIIKNIMNLSNET